MKDFNELREKYSDFIFKSYKISKSNRALEIEFEFITEGLESFNPRWIIPILNDNYIDEKMLDKLAFNLGLAELVSYWKATCSKNIIIEAGYLDDEQIRWWKKLYFKGLGEFFYVNNIDVNYEDYVNITSTCNFTDVKYISSNSIASSLNLIPLGGGKDSLVTMELLSDMKDSNYFLSINTNEVISDMLKIGRYSRDRLLAPIRQLDKKIIKLNNKGYLNGHTPFSSVIAFSSLLTSYINNMQYIILSNESSANDAYVKDSDVNHQYSKSFEFELDFVNYTKIYLDCGITYFSYLRPFNEYQIAKYFSTMDSYLPVFRSCNLGSKKKVWKWCCSCSKCLFTYIMLSPFVSEEKLVAAFGENLLNKEELLEDFYQLIGVRENKPFECVGSREEVNIALCEYLKKNSIVKLPYLLDKYIKTSVYREYKDNNDDKLKCFFDNNNMIPTKFIESLRSFVDYVKK